MGILDIFRRKKRPEVRLEIREFSIAEDGEHLEAQLHVTVTEAPCTLERTALAATAEGKGALWTGELEELRGREFDAGAATWFPFSLPLPDAPLVTLEAVATIAGGGEARATQEVDLSDSYEARQADKAEKERIEELKRRHAAKSAQRDAKNRKADEKAKKAADEAAEKARLEASVVDDGVVVELADVRLEGKHDYVIRADVLVRAGASPRTVREIARVEPSEWVLPDVAGTKLKAGEEKRFPIELSSRDRDVQLRTKLAVRVVLAPQAPQTRAEAVVDATEHRARHPFQPPRFVDISKAPDDPRVQKLAALAEKFEVQWCTETDSRLGVLVIDRKGWTPQKRLDKAGVLALVGDRRTLDLHHGHSYDAELPDYETNLAPRHLMIENDPLFTVREAVQNARDEEWDDEANWKELLELLQPLAKGVDEYYRLAQHDELSSPGLVDELRMFPLNEAHALVVWTHGVYT